MKSRIRYWLFVLVAVIFISGCIQQEGTQEQKITTVPQLGSLCSGEDACNNFCKDNLGRCKEYCKNSPDNPLCQKPFAFEIVPKETPTSSPVQMPSITPSPTPSPVQTPSSGCKGTGVVSFTSPPMRIEDVGHIIPLGQMSGGHVTPTDHGYYHPPNWKPQEIEDPSKFRDVLAPADGIITSINIVGNKRGDYRLEIQHTCTFHTIYIHVRELPPKILQITGEITREVRPNIPATAGEVIGRANGFDFSVHDDEVTLKGFIVPSHYDAESWKIHTVDMFAHFVEPLRAQLLAKNVRQAEPRSGKIDYDIDGKLVGNWFVENSGGYGGAEPYWTTHLSLTYNWLDPSLIIVSIGNFSGEARQFAVKGNSPDPAAVSTASGLVKYELVGFEYMTEGGWWDRVSFAKISRAVESGQVSGVALVQMIEDRKIKFEVFPGKMASEVSGFSNPTIYER